MGTFARGEGKTAPHVAAARPSSVACVLAVVEVLWWWLEGCLEWLACETEVVWTSCAEHASGRPAEPPMMMMILSPTHHFF
jgi:hypothetical protein